MFKTVNREEKELLTLRGVGVEAVPQKMCYFNRAESVKKAPWCGREARDFWAEQE